MSIRSLVVSAISDVMPITKISQSYVDIRDLSWLQLFHIGQKKMLVASSHSRIVTLAVARRAHNFWRLSRYPSISRSDARRIGPTMGLLRRRKRDIRVPAGRDAVNFRKLLFLPINETQDLLTNEAWARVRRSLARWLWLANAKTDTTAHPLARPAVFDADEGQDAASVLHRAWSAQEGRQAHAGVEPT